MVSNPRYPIKLILKDHGPDFDLKPFLESVEYVETGNDEISHARIVLTSKFGKFVNNVTQAGASIPQIQFFDRIYLEFTDPNSDITKDVLEVLPNNPGEKLGTGNTIELYCEHQGWYFNRGHNLKQYQRESGFDVIKDQGNVYNDPDVLSNNAPTMEGHDVAWNPTTEIGNAASEATAIDFDFGNKAFYFGEAVEKVSDRLGSTVENLGELEYFDWRTISKYDHSTGIDIDTIQMQFRVSGDVTSKEIIDKADNVDKILDIEGTLEPEKATNIYAWGAITAGSLLPGFQIYFGEKEAFFTAKDWTDTRVYKIGMRVQYKGSYYVSLQNHTASDGVNDPVTGIGSFWNVETFTPSVDYSQLTKNKPQYWLNSGAGYIHSTTYPANGRACCHDQNLVIRDGVHRRSWVDVRVISKASIPTTMHLGSGGSEMYRGFRILVDSSIGALGAPFNLNGSKDRFDKDYADNIVKHNGGTFTGSDEYKNWDVFLEKADDMEIIVMRDGESYVWNPSDNLTFFNVNLGTRTTGWQEGAYVNLDPLFGGAVTSAVFLAGALPDCLHPYNIVAINNPDFGNAQGVESGTPGTNSAVRVKYQFTDGARSNGFWINLAFPTPRDGFAGAFTATTAGEIYANPTLDLNNMHLSSLGKRGLNQGVDSDGRGALDYGKLNALRYYFKLIATEIGGLENVVGGQFKFRVAMLDTSDNVFVKDVTLSHKSNWDELTAHFPFESYRGRSGIAFTPVQELEILDILETRNIVRMSISSLNSYDDNGRYKGVLSGFVPIFGAVEGQLDAFHFIKPLTATTQKETVKASKPDRNLEIEPLDRPQIHNYVQLDHDAESQLRIEQFKRKEYVIRRPLRCNVKFGQEFTLKHPRVVNDTDAGASDEIDLVCKKNIYNYSKGKGRGGYTVTTYGVKRVRV